MKIVLFLICILLICGCASWSPYYPRYKELNNAYNYGQLTYAEYMNLKTETERQERLWAIDFSNSMQSTPAPTYTPRYDSPTPINIGSSVHTYPSTNSLSNTKSYQTVPTYNNQIETISDRNARHQAEEYQARQSSSPYQIDPHRDSPLGDATTQADLERFGK